MKKIYFLSIFLLLLLCSCNSDKNYIFISQDNNSSIDNTSTLLNYVPYTDANKNITLNNNSNLIIPIRTKIIFKNSTGGNIQILNMSSDTSNYLTLTGNFISTGTLRTDGDIYTTGSGDNIWLGTSTENSALTWFNSSGSGILKNLTLGFGNVTQSNIARNYTLNINGSSNFDGGIYALQKLGVTASGTLCTITQITNGIITNATCI
jgi:hypothetical protein